MKKLDPRMIEAIDEVIELHREAIVRMSAYGENGATSWAEVHDGCSLCNAARELMSEKNQTASCLECPWVLIQESKTGCDGYQRDIENHRESIKRLQAWKRGNKYLELNQPLLEHDWDFPIQVETQITQFTVSKEVFTQQLHTRLKLYGVKWPAMLRCVVARGIDDGDFQFINELLTLGCNPHPGQEEFLKPIQNYLKTGLFQPE